MCRLAPSPAPHASPHMASIRPHRDKWRAFIEVGAHKESRVFASQREAKSWAAAREVELRRERSARPADLYTVRQMLERYKDEVSVRKRGQRAEELRIDAFLRDSDLADRKLSEVDTPDLGKWRDARLKVATPATVQRDINWLRNAWAVARDEWKWADANPFKGLKMPGDNPPRTRRIAPGEVRRLCRHLSYRTGQTPATKSQEVALAFLLGLRSGMRAGEILSLGKDTVDLERRVARIEQHKTAHLTGRPREVPLTRAAVRLLRPVAELPRCFSLTPASLDALFRKARDKLLIEDLHFHDSRGEALTRLARKVDVMTLARISGHKDLRILMEHYYRETPEQIAARL